MNILILNGPNLNLLGVREPEIYGRGSYDDLCAQIREKCKTLGIGVSFFQSNHEGALVDAIQEARGKVDGIVFNPAAYTHTSIALPDALRAVSIPTVEVHLSDPDTREPFRRVSYVRAACVKTIVGHGFAGYLEAVEYLAGYLAEGGAE